MYLEKQKEIKGYRFVGKKYVNKTKKFRNDRRSFIPIGVFATYSHFRYSKTHGINEQFYSLRSKTYKLFIKINCFYGNTDAASINDNNYQVLYMEDIARWREHIKFILSEIFFPREDKLHMFKPTCNFLFIT